MIEAANRTFRLLAVLALSIPLACKVDAGGQIPCADDSSCPTDYPVCSAGKCIAGTSSSTNSIAIVGVQGHDSSDILRGTVTVSVTAKASSGIQSVGLTAGTKTYTPTTASAAPLFLFDVVTSEVVTSAGDADVTATLTAGDGSTSTTPKLTIHIDNGQPTLTIALIGSANVADGSLVKFDVTTNKAVSSVTGTVSGTGSGALSEISPATGLVRHFGYAVGSADAEGAHNVTFTAVDAAGNSGSSTSTAAFNVRHPFAIATLTASTALTPIGGVTAAKKDTVVTVSATLPNTVTFASGVTPVFKLTSAAGGTVRTLATPTKTPGTPNETWSTTYTILAADHDGLASVTVDATDVAGNVAVTKTTSVLIDETAPALSSLAGTPASSDTVHSTVVFTGVSNEPLQSATVATTNLDTGTCKCDGLTNCAADTAPHPIVTCTINVTHAASGSLINATATVTTTDLVGNAVGSTAGYTVVPPPAGITLTPATQTITLGTTASLTAHFSGGGTFALLQGDDNTNVQVQDNVAVQVSPTVDTTYTLDVTNAAGTDDTTKTASVHVVAAPTITSFVAAPTVISSGDPATLTAVFSAGAGGTATIDNGVGSVTTGVGKVVSPTTTTTYTLTVTNAAGTQAHASVTVTVGAIPVLTFTKSASSILPGGSVNLTANVSNAVSASIDPGAITVATDGVDHITSVSPAVTTTYTLTAVNGAGLASHLTQTVTVTPASVTTFTATASPINAGATPQVTPTFTPASATGVISLSTDAAARPCGTSIVSGTPVSCAAINADTTYVLTVTAGTSTDVAQVSVKANVASITSFTAAAATVNAGAQPQVTPTWTPTSGSPAATVAISDGSGGTPCGTTFTSGNQVTCNAINATTVYTLTVTQGTTVATKTVTVVVTPAAITSFTAAATTVNAGAQPSLTPTWTPTSGSPAATVAISDGSGGTPCGTTFTSGNAVSCTAINATTTYTLTVTLGTTVATKTVHVTVTPAAITSFTAAAATVNAGAQPSLTPTWTPTSGSPAATVAISDGSGGTPCGTTFTSGNAVSCTAINATTTYTLTVTLGATVATKTVQVAVTPAAITSFTAAAGTINAGAQPSLTPTWTPTSGSPAATVAINDGAGGTPCGSSFTSGNAVSCTAINATTTYTLTVTLGTTKATKTVQVTVTPAAITSFTAAAGTVNAGAQPSLTPTWTPTSGSPAATVAISDGSGGTPCGSSFTSGNAVSCTAINATTTYTLTVTLGTTVATKTVQVVVTPAAITSFNATATRINAGAQPQLTPIWTPTTGSPAATVTISDGGGGTPCGSSFTSGTPVSCTAITANTTYTLRVQVGTTVATTTTQVTINPFISSWTAVTPTLGSAGGSPSLIPVFGPPNATGAITFTSGGASACGGTATSGTAAACASISNTTQYHLTVSANGGTDATADVTVTVAASASGGLTLVSSATAATNAVTKANSTTSNAFTLTPTFCSPCTATLFDGTSSTAVTSATPVTGKTITATTTYTLTARNAAGEVASTDLTITLLPGSSAATTGAMAQKRFGATTTLLTNGKVLIAGGRTTQATASTARNDAEIYDPSDNSFHALGAAAGSGATMQDARYQASAVLLPSGLVLISGGMKGNGQVVTSQDWYDPAKDGFLTAAPANMATARMGHSATLMFDNTVMIYGGSTDGTNATALNTGELYTDGAGVNTAITFAGTAPLARYRHTATVLADARVLFAGGILAAGTTPTKVDIISKSGATFTGSQPAGTLQVARSGGHAAVRLADARILLVGGTASSGTTPFAEIGTISGATANFAATTGGMSFNRCNVGAVALPNGNVLVSGGTNCTASTAQQSAEVFSYSSGSFNPTATPVVGRQEYGATFLFNGSAVILGGDSANATAETYNPN